VRQFGIEHVNVIIGVLLVGLLLLAVRLGQIRVYQDTDAAGAAHGDCLLTAYEPASAIQTSAAPAGGSIVARVAVRYVVLQQLPD